MLFGKKKEEKKVTPLKKDGELSNSQIREKLQEGWIRVMIVFELVGKPKEHVQETLKAYLANIKSDERVIKLKEEFGDVEEQEGGLFSTFCEMESIVKNMETLTWLAINFMPASIEIISPDQLSIEAREIMNWYNDLLAKLHETSDVLRDQRSINAHMTESLNALIQNGIKLATEKGKTPKEIEKVLGIDVKQLEPFLKHMTEKGALTKKGQKYQKG